MRVRAPGLARWAASFVGLAFSLSLGACSSSGEAPTWSISGTISGAGSQGITVALGGPRTASTTTDTTGHFAFTGLANGSYTLTPALAGYTFTPATRSVSVRDADVGGQDFAAARLCLDPNNARLVITVDFNPSAKNGNCAAVDRFKWATDAPGKVMFFVGWVHRDSVLQDLAVNNELGASTPNQIAMYDDGSNGDEVAGDNVWTVTFIIPKGDPATGQVFRIGYKFTWGTHGAPWSGSEEWPGNSRILEVVDVNGDGFVYRHEVFGDEATNKDFANLNLTSTGSITWTTDLHGCGPEARENTYDFKTCACGAFQTPKGVEPPKVACLP